MVRLVTNQNRYKMRLTSSVDAMGTLLLGTITDGGLEADDGGLGLLLAGLGNSLVDGREIAMIAKLNQCFP